MPTGSRFAKSAPAKAKYVLVSLNDTLPRGRRLVAVSPLGLTDGGDGGDLSLAVGDASSSAKGVVRLPGVQLGGTAADPDVRGIRTTSGPTLLEFGAITDGQALVRAGTSIVGQAVLSSSRTVATSGGLTGGGALTSDRTLSIAGFTGIIAKDVNPGTATWTNMQTQVHLTVDAGSNTMLIPMAVRLPPCVDAALVTEVVLGFDSGPNSNPIGNSNTTTALDLTTEDLVFLALGNLVGDSTVDGRRVTKVIFQTRNVSSGTVSDKDIGSFRLRAWAVPVGGGSAI